MEKHRVCRDPMLLSNCSFGRWDARIIKIYTLVNSEKGRRYINNFTYFPQHEAISRVATIEEALKNKSTIELFAALDPDRVVSFKERVLATKRAAHDVLALTPRRLEALTLVQGYEAA